jgi:hypothetical protein
VPLRRKAEAGIEEAGVMHPELAHLGRDRDHFGRMVRRNMQLLLGGQDIKLVRVEGEAPVRTRPDQLPEILDLVGADPVDVEHARVAAGAVPDQPIGADAVERDAQHEAVPHIEVAVDQRRAGVQLAQLRSVRARTSCRSCMELRGGESGSGSAGCRASRARENCAATLGVETPW